MAVTENNYTGDNSTVLFSFTFPYLETTDIRVSLNGIITTAYTLASATQIQFNTAPGSGVAIRIYRETADDVLKAEFFPGSAIRAQDLNDDFNQAIYLTQEVRSIAVSASTANIANASITSDKIASGAVTETKLGSAAVSESKIAAGACTESKLGTGAVTTTKILNGSVTAAKAVIASQAQAEAGVDTTTLMTPERTKQAILASNANINYQEFSSSGTWTKPAICNYVMVEVWGAGGGGASGDKQTGATSKFGGSGGGGGAYNYRIFRASELASSETITIGAGGTGGAARSTVGRGNFGTGGGATSFGTLLYGYGGGGGANADNTSYRNGGGGGGSLGTAETYFIAYGGNPRIAQANDPVGNTVYRGYQIYGGGNGASSYSDTSYRPGRSMYGGGGGGAVTVSTPTTYDERQHGARSIYAGPGGGAGGSIDTGTNVYNGGQGGSQTTDWGGGGAAGADGGGAGSAGAAFQGGGGGGTGVGVNAGIGGAGGTASGGGGGGGCNTADSGAGGAGGNGLCRVWTW